jgi:hypothetical protein
MTPTNNNFRVVFMIVTLCCVSLLKPTAIQAKQVPRPYLIVPGFSIGKVQLGQSQDEVHQKMGRPEKSVAGQCTTILYNNETNHFDYKPVGVFIVDTWTRRDKTARSFEVIYKNNKVIQITNSLSGYSTKNHLTIGSTFNDFVKRFGEAGEAHEIWFDHDLDKPIGESAIMESNWDFIKCGLAISSEYYRGMTEPTTVVAISVHQANQPYLFN